MPRFAAPLMTLAAISAAAIGAVIGGAVVTSENLAAQRADPFGSASETRTALRQARAEAAAAELRGNRLDKAAREATRAAEKTARQAAALAARIQQAESGLAAAEARVSLIDRQRSALERRLADRREPLVRLTAALQKLARRPVALSALRPGSLRETVYMRAMLESTIPQVRARTSGLRSEVEREQRLEAQAQRALASLRTNEAQLDERRTSLAAIESRQRLTSRRASGDAARETDRALALAEQARDLNSLVGQFEREGTLRQELAALPGPILRPARPAQSKVIGNAEPRSGPTIQASTDRAALPRFQFPVTGRIISGFGERGAGGSRNSGLTLAPRKGAQVVVPAAGRVAFAGPYRGYGNIVIIEHSGSWTSLVTGLARTNVTVGQQLLDGAPLGVAEVERPAVMLELRRGGKLVNPLEFAR